MRVRPLMLLGLGAGLFGGLCWYFGLDGARLAVRELQPAYFVVYLILAATALCGYSARWYFMARTLGTTPPFARLVAARVAGDALGSLLPGSRVAGDPLRIAFVHAAGVPGSEAAAGVTIDRLLEVIGNGICAAIYLTVWLHAQRGPTQASESAIVTVLLLLAALAIPLVMLWCGVRPLGWLYGGTVPHDRWRRFFYETEGRLLAFFHDHAGAFLAGVLGSLLIEGLLIVEYGVLLQAFGIGLDLSTLLMVLLASGVARVVPTPGALGALEAGQVTALTLSGGSAELGFVVGLVIRFHDTLWTAIGLAVLAARGDTLARLRRLAVPGAVA